jgi:hypothetical protein
MEGDTLVMFVSIPYIRERLAPLGDSFILRLHGFHSLEFDDGKNKHSYLTEISKSGIEILSTDSESMPVKISTTSGFLTLDFDRIDITTDTGRSVSYEEIYKACFEFWEDWSIKAKALQK